MLVQHTRKYRGKRRNLVQESVMDASATFLCLVIYDLFAQKNGLPTLHLVGPDKAMNPYTHTRKYRGEPRERPIFPNMELYRDSLNNHV